MNIVPIRLCELVDFGSLKTLAAFTSSLISRPLRFREGS